RRRGRSRRGPRADAIRRGRYAGGRRSARAARRGRRGARLRRGRAARAGPHGGVTPRRERNDMKLEGIHHVTAITADAPGNVDFYARVLGLRLVKKTVNQDDPTVYHLFYADERGSAGSDITFFEYPDTPRGRAGAGMVHRIAFRVASEKSLAFWQERVGGERNDGSLIFDDP